MTCEYPLPIDLVEPCPDRVEGDRLPCHLFMPEVAWPEAMPPVLRERPRRELWLQSRDPWAIEPSTDLLGPPGVGRRVVLFIVGAWLCGAAVIVASHLKGWL